MADIGVVAVDQVAVNVLLAGFAQVAVVFQQLDVLAFLASAIDSVRGVEILSAAIDTAVQLDILSGIKAQHSRFIICYI